MEEPLDVDITDKFKEIFDLCDVDSDGYIDVEHFKGLAKEHFGADGTEEVTGIINLLDPEGRGLISYNDFCQGIQQILELQHQASPRSSFQSSVSVETLVPLDIAGDLTILEVVKEIRHKRDGRENERREWINDNHDPHEDKGMTSSRSTSSASGINNVNPAKNSPSTNSQLTYGEYDFSGLDDFSGLGVQGSDSLHLPEGQGPFGLTDIPATPILIPAVSEDEGDSAISGKSSEVNESSRQEITDEENFEDYGEIESEADASDQGHLTPGTDRKRSDRKDALSRHAKKSCPNRRLTTAALASALQRSSRNSPSSTRRSSFGSDEIFDDIDGNFQDVNGRLKFLEDQLQNLTETQIATNTKQSKLKDENSVLIQKVHYLEEQLRDMEVRSDDRLTEEHRKHQEYLSRYDREKSDQVDYITQRLHRVEEEYEELKEEAPRLRSEIEKLRLEKMEIQERLLERQENYNILYEDHEKLKLDYHKQDNLHQRERQTTGQLLDEMGKELEELRRYRVDTEAGVRTPRGSISEMPGKYTDLQKEIHKLKEENRHLHDSNEELNAQLLNQCIGEGKSLLKDPEGQSLAQELEHLTKEELLAQLRMERDINMRLKQYVDRIIITILEKNPSLLEITNSR